MWNNSYRTPTECWQKTSDFPLARKSPCTSVGQQKKFKKDKRIGTGLAPLGGSCEGGKVSTHKEAPSLVETRGGWGVSFGATEESASTGVLQRRDSRTEDWCQPAFTSLRHLSAHLPGWVGAGS